MNKIVKFLCRLLGCCAPTARLRFSLDGAQFSVEGESLEVSMNNEQTIVASIAPKTKQGNPATIDGSANFSAEPPEAGTFEQVSRLSARFKPATGFVGAVQVNVTADADLDEGETRTIQASGAINVTSAEAETLEVSFGEPEG